MTEPSVPAVPIMSKAKARRLIDRIKTKADDLWTDILEAHDGGAWKALGYKSWAECAEVEFGKSRSRSYQLLSHARLMGELTAAKTNPQVEDSEVSTQVDRLTERDTRPLTDDDRTELVADVAAAKTPAEADAAIEQALAKSAKKARAEAERAVRNVTATHRSLAYEVQFVDPELTDLVNLAVIEQVSVETMIVRLALIQLAHVKETGEVPATAANGRSRWRQPEAAPANGDDHKHVASKPKSSGLVVCEICNLPRDRWPDRLPVARAVPRVERQSVDVPTAFKGSGKK